MERFYGSTNSKCKRYATIPAPARKISRLRPFTYGNGGVVGYFIAYRGKGQSAISLASDIVQSFDDGVYGLNRMTVDNLTKIKGIGRDKAVTLCAALEMGRRLGELKIKETYEDFSQPFV